MAYFSVKFADTAYAQTSFEKASLTVMGLQMSVSYTGGAISPLIFGILADRFSFNLLPYYILFGAVIIFIFSEYLNHNLKKYKSI